ncbi:MAG: type II toxin-antitoxin system RelE/ParE family toxin [Candidatus Fermentibacteria bacterium]|nr:type II toxin-antitoxin system RelE/ParE family toxin [Candidatus Fermentibacteria bacterium]
MRWKIKYYNQKLENEILKLPAGLLARYLRLSDLLIEFGSNLGLPHTRKIEKGLFELRVKGKEGIARVFFCTKIGKTIIMLHSFIKKSQKIPKREIEIAIRRKKEVLKNESF